MDSFISSTISPIFSGGVVDLEAFHSANLWVLILGFVVAFFLSFGIGANDVANTFGTSVGAKVISLKHACIIATIFEMLGAALVGKHNENIFFNFAYFFSLFCTFSD